MRQKSRQIHVLSADSLHVAETVVSETPQPGKAYAPCGGLARVQRVAWTFLQGAQLREIPLDRAGIANVLGVEFPTHVQ